VKTYTPNGNFKVNRNVLIALGEEVPEHFHVWSHTVLPVEGLFQITAWDNPDCDNEFDVNKHPLLGSTHVGYPRYAKAHPDIVVHPWALIDAKRFHVIRLVSLTSKVGESELIETQGEFWCCWSHRKVDGEVVQYDTGWSGALS